MIHSSIPAPPFTLREASWQQDCTEIAQLRRTVFIEEQCVPDELEWDGLDEDALHILAEDVNGNAIATARMLTDGHIGRVAVLRSWRGLGVGRALMSYLLEMAQQRGDSHVFLDAQVDAIDFYRRLGFVAEGAVFMDAGIPHRHMHLALDGEHQSA
jgi:predicted GNAT family N-acyltransferase